MPAEKRNYILSYLVRGFTAVIVLVICLVVVMALNATAPKAGEVQATVTPQSVRVFEAKQIELQRQWRGYGVAAAIDRADVPSRVAATVISISPTIQAGRPIKLNELIVRLDASDFQRQVDQAEHRITELDALLKQIEVEEKRYAQRLLLEKKDVALAQAEATRIESLFKIDAAKQFEFDAAMRSVIAAERAALNTEELMEKIIPRKEALKALREGQVSSKLAAQQNVDRCEILSPLEGILESVDVKLGESLQPGQRVARVVSLSRIEVPVQLPVAARPDLILGGRVELRPTNDMTHCWDATIVRMSPADDATTRTMTVFAEVDQKQLAAQFGTAGAANLLTPGQFLSATTWSASNAPRWVVPRRSIRAGRVLVVRDGIITSKPVMIDYLNEGAVPGSGVPDDQWAVLLDEGQPLKAGDLVVLNASVALRDGDKISPVTAAPDAALVPTTDSKPTASSSEKTTAIP